LGRFQIRRAQRLLRELSKIKPDTAKHFQPRANPSMQTFA